MSQSLYVSIYYRNRNKAKQFSAMSDGHLAEVQAELDIEKRTRDEVEFLSVNTTGLPIKVK